MYNYQQDQQISTQYCVEVSQKSYIDQSSNLLRIRNPVLFSQIDRSRYTEEYLNKITYGTHTKLWWICPINPCGCHVWDASVAHRSGGKGCPFCARNGKRRCIHQSFMNIPHMAADFDSILNPGVDPYKISYGSDIVLNWRCRDHKTCNEHVYQSTVANGNNCPFCSSHQTCRCNSFINNPVLASEFYQELNPGIDPIKIPIFSHINVKWVCQKHKTCNEHIWRSNVSHRSNGNGCPYCSNKLVCSCDNIMRDELLAKEFDFENPENVYIDPYKLSYGSSLYIWWKCSKCSYSWGCIVYNRTTHDSGCPSCSAKRTESRGEERCRLYLESIGINSFKQTRLKYIPSRRYDFMFEIEKSTVYVEFDGEQHFKFKSEWHENEEKFISFQDIDKVKTFMPLVFGFSILRISNSSESNIKRAMDTILYLKRIPEISKTPIIVFDDISKYQHLINYLSEDLIRKYCSSSFHEEIIDNLYELTVYIYDIKSNKLLVKSYSLNDKDC